MKTSENLPKHEAPQQTSRSTPTTPHAPATTHQKILALQRSHGNRAVQRYVATIQRLADTRRATGTNPQGKIDIQTLTLSEAREYLEYAKWLRSPKTSGKVPPEVTFGNREGEELQLGAHIRKLETEESASKLDGLRKQVEQLRKGLVVRMGEIDKLARSLRNPDVGLAFVRQMQHFERMLKESENLEPKAASAKMTREEATEGHLKNLVLLLQKSIDDAVPEVQALGLPKLDAATINDWQLLEGEKDRARKVREPIDSVLMAFAPRISALIPKATLNYRGSLARGVKSPKKYTMPAAGPALASFDAPFQEVDSKSGRHTASAASYDIDLNIEAPYETLTGKGLQTGPLDKTEASNTTRQELEALLLELKEALTKLAIPALDVAGCKFFINTTGKTMGQLDQGTPYTPAMLTNANMPNLATGLPQAYSPELISKVIEYANAAQARVINGQQYYYPPQQWDPLMAQMFNHIVNNGPKATFMPEVQVEVGPKTTREYTAMPRPTGGVSMAQQAPHNPLTQHGGGFRGPLVQCAGPMQVAVGAIFVGRVSQQLRNNKSVLVDIGGGVTCFLPGPFLALGHWGIFEVTGLATPHKNASVRYHGQY